MGLFGHWPSLILPAAAFASLATSQIAKLLYLPKHYLIAVITTFLISRFTSEPRISVTSWS